MPAWFFFIFGLMMYLNFTVEAGGDTMYPWCKFFTHRQPYGLVGLVWLFRSAR
jgi:hypothetical protein